MNPDTIFEFLVTNKIVGLPLKQNKVELVDEYSINLLDKIKSIFGFRMVIKQIERFLLGIILTCFQSFCHSQNNEIDSLLLVLRSNQNEKGVYSEKINYDLLFNIGLKTENSDPDTAIYFYKQAQQKAKNLKEEIKEAEALSKTGWCLYIKSNYPAALEQFTISLSIIENYLRKNKTENSNTALIARATNYKNIGAVYSKKGNFEEAQSYFNKGLEIFQELNYKKGIASIYESLSSVFYDQGNYPKALDVSAKALSISREINDKNAEAGNLAGIANIYSNQGDYSKALENYFSGLRIYEAQNNKIGMANNFGNIGTIYYKQGDYLKSKEYFLLALKENKLLGNKSGVATNLGNIGLIFEDKEELDSAMLYYSQALAIEETLDNTTGIARQTNNIGGIYEMKGDYSKALEYLFKAVHLNKAAGNKPYLKTNLANIGAIYLKQKKFKDSEIYIKDAISIGRELRSYHGLKTSYLLLSDLYKAMGRFSEALDAYKNHIANRDSIVSNTNRKASIQKEMQYNFNKEQDHLKAEQDKKDVLNSEEKRRQLIIIYATSLFGALALLLVIVIFRSLRINQKKNKIINEQKHLVEAKHKEITDSINYAERIQRSFIATKALLDENLNDYFVLFKPKDVVSGDFYWAGKLNNGTFALATADSTGHGVPGAIMSLLNVTSIETAIKDGFTEPCDILNATRKTIIERLKKDGSEEGGKDGMDCSFICFNFNARKLVVAAANHPIWIMRGSETIEIKPDKMPLGKHEKENVSFSQTEITLQENDIIYTLTDGFADQFGGEKGKKFKSKNLRELLAANAHLPINKQKELLEETFINWAGNIEQVDDVTVIGIRVKFA